MLLSSLSFFGCVIFLFYLVIPKALCPLPPSQFRSTACPSPVLLRFSLPRCRTTHLPSRTQANPYSFARRPSLGSVVVHAKNRTYPNKYMPRTSTYSRSRFVGESVVIGYKDEVRSLSYFSIVPMMRSGVWWCMARGLGAAMAEGPRRTQVGTRRPLSLRFSPPSVPGVSEVSLSRSCCRVPLCSF